MPFARSYGETSRASCLETALPFITSATVLDGEDKVWYETHLSALCTLPRDADMPEPPILPNMDLMRMGSAAVRVAQSLNQEQRQANRH